MAQAIPLFLSCTISLYILGERCELAGVMALKAEFLESTADASVPHDSRRVWKLRWVSLTHTHLMRPYPTPRLILPALMAMILFLFQTQFDMREFNKPF